MTTALVLVGAVLLFIAAIAFAADWWERRQQRRESTENARLTAELAAAESLLAQLAAENTWLHDELDRRDTRHLRAADHLLRPDDDYWMDLMRNTEARR